MNPDQQPPVQSTQSAESAPSISQDVQSTPPSVQPVYSSVQPPVPPIASIPPEKAPTVLLVLTTLMIIVSIIGIILGLGAFLLQNGLIYILGGGITPEGVLYTLISLIPAIMGAISLVVALALRRLKKWGYYAYIVCAVLGLLLSGFAFMQGEAIDLISLVISIALFMYFYSIREKFVH